VSIEYTLRARTRLHRRSLFRRHSPLQPGEAPATALSEPLGNRRRTVVELHPAADRDDGAPMRRRGYLSCFVGLHVVALVTIWAALDPSPSGHGAVILILWAGGAVGAFVLAWEMFALATDLRIVWVLCFIAYAYALLGLQLVDHAGAFLAGRIATQAAIAAFMYATLSYPSGRLRSEPELGFFWVAIAGMALLLLACVLFSTILPTAGPLLRCSPSGCPHNPVTLDALSLSAGRRLTQALAVWSGSCVLIAAGLTAIRIREYSPRQRSVFAGAIAWMVLICVGFGVMFISRGISDRPVPLWVAIVGTAALAVTPIAHAIAFLRGRVMTSSGLQRILPGIEAGVGPAVVQDALGRAFADPDLRLLLRQPEGAYVDVDGTPVDPSRVGEGREVTELTRDGRPAAILVHDALLQNDRGGLQTAGAAVLLTLDNHRLQADLQRSVEELQRSRRRVAEAVHEERARVERDLHDGAQQFLIGIGHRVSRLRAEAGDDPELRAELDLITGDVEYALEGVRELTQGIYPPVLRILGLGPALATLARDVPVSVSSELRCDRRFAPMVEAAVYFCCSEALQNVQKHCPPTVSAIVRLIGDDEGLAFEIADDGPGFDVTHLIASTGLAGMRDRINAIGGELYIHSAPDRGTTVTGGIPAREL
jgi:signal transduction histidine kinase